jgi:hypothetical protein
MPMETISTDASEGDVETRVVLPLLTRAEFLGVPLEQVRSKEGISARDIGKGTKRKVGYVPDFLVYAKSLPIVVVEAKSPANDVGGAYAEARLYALELNRSFPPNINPCCRVIATNGIELLAGSWDSEPSIIATVADMSPGSAKLDELISLAGADALRALSDPISRSLRAADFARPFSQGAGPSQIESHVEPNTFAADLSPALRRYFSSRDQTTDAEIYSRAYISSDEVTSYDRILESFLRDRLARSKSRTEINTSRRKAAAITKSISAFDASRPIGGDLQLVTGGVGAGKSLFARRYREYLQPAELAGRNHWAFINFISPPEDFAKWNDWVCENFARSIADEGAPVDLRDAGDQERVFANDLADRSAYYARMEAIQTGRGDLEKARDIEQWRLDPLKLTRGLARYLQGDRAENLIVVFDNVDRRETDAQLTAFQAALWFMEQTRAMVILQMRDSTFEAYKNSPPLDTYRTGQIFHISPPRFIDVVKRRLELSLEYLAQVAPEQVKFTTKSGVTISYPKGRSGEFLTGIYNELFQSRSNVARVLEALAGRNVRRALDMFLAIITSGHIPEEVIASVAQGVGFQRFPEHLILRALMRQDYRFFSNNSGFVANIFHCTTRWERPSNLLVPEILFYLVSQRKVRGDNGQTGFVGFPRLLVEMENLGFVRGDVSDATQFCLSKELVEVDTSSLDMIRDRDSLKATASGWAHMRLLSSRLEYLAALLPTTAINDKQLSARVFDLMQTENRIGRLPFYQAVQVVENFEGYLRKQNAELAAHPGYAGRARSGSGYVLAKVAEAIQFARRDVAKATGQADLLDF